MGERAGGRRITILLERRTASEVRAVIANALHPFSSRALGKVTLHPHQTEGAARLRTALHEFGGALLADEVGLGKTYTALAVARDYAPCMVVAPAVLREMWSSAGMRAGVALTFVSHEQLSRGAQTPPAGCVVVDEAHHARNPATRRYATLARLCAGARVLLLSATPVHNSERDLVALLALFLGERARHLGAPERERVVVRRRAHDLRTAPVLPGVAPVEWHAVPPAPGVLQALRDIPPPLPAADGSAAPALFTLSLVRLWASSDAAVRAALRRLVARGLALSALLAEGRLPTRKEFRAWQVDSEGVQLAFDFASSLAGTGVRRLQRAVGHHLTAVRHALATLGDSERGVGPDAGKAAILTTIVASNNDPVVAFTQFEATARALYERLRAVRGVALCTGRGARMDGHAIQREALLRALGAAARPPDRDAEPQCAGPSLFDTAALVRHGAPALPTLAVRLLITTDLLSEGVDLQRATHVVHLDLPWTPARMEQRLGRLRRPGAGADCIRVSAFRLPDESERVLSLVRTLQRKAVAASRFTGARELLEGAPWTATTDSEHGAAGGERLLAAIASWKGAAGAPVTTGAVPCAVVRAISSETGWVALALVEDAAGHGLLLLTEEGESRAAAAITRKLVALGGPDSAATVPAALLAHWERWAASQRGRALASPMPGASSRKAQTLVRRLQHLAAQAPRHERRQWSASLSALRQALDETRGAHVDRMVHELDAGIRRAAVVAPDAVAQAADHLRHLAHAWEPATDGAPRLAALLVTDPGAFHGRAVHD